MRISLLYFLFKAFQLLCVLFQVVFYYNLISFVSQQAVKHFFSPLLYQFVQITIGWYFRITFPESELHRTLILLLLLGLQNLNDFFETLDLSFQRIIFTDCRCFLILGFLWGIGRSQRNWFQRLVIQVRSVFVLRNRRELVTLEGFLVLVKEKLGDSWRFVRMEMWTWVMNERWQGCLLSGESHCCWWMLRLCLTSNKVRCRFNILYLGWLFW